MSDKTQQAVEALREACKRWTDADEPALLSGRFLYESARDLLAALQTEETDGLGAGGRYWRNRSDFWMAQAVALGWREKRDAENGESQPAEGREAVALTEQQKADRDAVLYGNGFMRDGKHIPADQVSIFTHPHPTASSEARQGVVVDDAMVERACEAYFNDGVHGWARFAGTRSEKLYRIAMRDALKAALASKQPTDTERDAARWNEFCRQAEAGEFHPGLLDDAKNMGAGALEMHIDDAMKATGEGS